MSSQALLSGDPTCRSPGLRWESSAAAFIWGLLVLVALRTSFQATEVSSWVVSSVESPRLRLFCIGAVGAGSADFKRWTALLPAQVQLAALRLPGHESRFGEQAFTNMTPAIKAMVQDAGRLPPLPQAVFGHCSGALLAFEFVRVFDQAQSPITRALIVATQPPPDRFTPAGITQASDEDLVRFLRTRGGTPDEVLQSNDLLSLLLPVLRGDLALADSFTYVAGARVSAPIVAIAARDDPSLDMAGWARFTASDFRLLEVAGGHFATRVPAPELINVVASLLP